MNKQTSSSASSSKVKILVVEDEEDIADLIKLQGELAGFKVVVAHDGLNGLRAVEREKPDLILLDIMLPGLNGLDVCRKLKGNPNTQHIPVIMLTAKSEEIDIVLGLELGADDYINKPFSTKILFSRIRAVLRRGVDIEAAPKVIEFAPFSLDVENYHLTKKGKTIPLTLTEYSLLKRLVSSRGKVLSRNQLLDEMTHADIDIVDRNIDVHIASLRKKMGPHFEGIETVRGIGYRFLDEE